MFEGFKPHDIRCVDSMLKHKNLSGRMANLENINNNRKVNHVR